MDVKTLCLGVLNRSEASGYEIKKAFEEGAFAHIHAASFGSIYPALNILCGEGKVVRRDESQDKRPDKKIYSITEAGRAALHLALMEPPAADRVRSDLLFILFFAQLLPAERLARLIDERIAWYRGHLQRMDCDDKAETPSAHPTPGERFVCGMGQAVYGAAADYLEQNRDTLIAEVEAAARFVAE